jgi:hypothetical protein
MKSQIRRIFVLSIATAGVAVFSILVTHISVYPLNKQSKDIEPQITDVRTSFVGTSSSTKPAPEFVEASDSTNNLPNAAKYSLRLNGGAYGPIELLITDPQGNRLGYDPTIDIRYDEIQRSYLFREGLAANINDEIGNFNDGKVGPINYSVGEFYPGNYTIWVFGIGNGKWGVNFGLLGDGFDFNPRAYTAYGIATSGSQVSYTFNVVVPIVSKN